MLFIKRMRGMEISLDLPDLWQQEAVRSLRAGCDVVVHAPTGAGKTFIFELLYSNLRGQAIFTVPTRALANDKLAEWRTRGWDVGISTGDISENLGARVVVATLETQKANFLHRRGPKLFVVDEYQLLGDEQRGVNYELCLALAPAGTQLLLLSGSVENPNDVVDWLQRIGRNCVLVSTGERPVPLEEIMIHDLRASLPANISGFWPKVAARAIANQFSPLLMFAPRRKTAEDLALAIAQALPAPDPLHLSMEQMHLAREPLGKMLRNRIAYHHSGLSYAVRAGLIEPLAKRGQLRVIVSTTGLAAGINFSVRSVMVTGTSYQSGHHPRELRPDELLQMFGRAGRRGLDEKGYVLTAPDLPRIFDARPRRLRRSDTIDWPSFISVMQAAVEHNESPCHAAISLTSRLFSTNEIQTGFEQAINWNTVPCGLRVDAERARFVRQTAVEMQNSRGEWELRPDSSSSVLERAVVLRNNLWVPALSEWALLPSSNLGNLCLLTKGRFKTYGRELTVATIRDNIYYPTQPVRKLLRENGYTKVRQFDEQTFHTVVWPWLKKLSTGTLLPPAIRQHLVLARFSFASYPVEIFVDQYGENLIEPNTRREFPQVCLSCQHKLDCESQSPSLTPALAWRKLGLIEMDGRPTRRGRIFSYFSQGEGLAIAAALEKSDYPMDDLLYDLANLRAGHRFSGEDSPYGGRLGFVCAQTYDRAEYPGYLEFGVPIGYGAGAAEVIREIQTDKSSRNRLLTSDLRVGDIERAQMEWLSLLRQISNAPILDWPRWEHLKLLCATFLEQSVKTTPSREHYF